MIGDRTQETAEEDDDDDEDECEEELLCGLRTDTDESDPEDLDCALGAGEPKEGMECIGYDTLGHCKCSSRGQACSSSAFTRVIRAPISISAPVSYSVSPPPSPVLLSPILAAASLISSLISTGSSTSASPASWRLWLTTTRWSATRWRMRTPPSSSSSTGPRSRSQRAIRGE